MLREKSTIAGCSKDILLLLLEGGKSFEQLVSQLGGKYSRGTVNKYLNELYSLGWVKREGRRGPYILTEQGERKANLYKQAQMLSELAPLPHVKILLEAGDAVFSGKMKTLYKVAPEVKAYFDVVIFFDAKKQAILDKIAGFLKGTSEKEYPQTSLRLIAGMFIDMLKEAMYNAYGFRDWRGWEKEPLPVLEIIEQERKALDFEATLLLHFNGKELVKQIDWEENIERFRALDERVKECWRVFVETVAENLSAQHYWLVDETIEKVRKVESLGVQKFLAAAFYTKRSAFLEDMWAAFDTAEKARQALLNEVFESIFPIIVEGSTGKPVPDIPQPSELTEQEMQELKEAVKVRVEEALNMLVREGVIEFVPIYLPKLNKEKAMQAQLKAKSRYPTPTAYLT